MLEQIWHRGFWRAVLSPCISRCAESLDEVRDHLSSLKITWPNILKMPAYKTAIGLIVVVIAATDYSGASADEWGFPLRTECRRTLSKTADQGESQSGNDECIPGECKKTCGSTTSIMHNTSGEFQGAMHIPIANQVTEGWIAEIEFRNKVNVLQIWDAIIQSCGTTNEEYSTAVIINVTWNGNLSAGTSLNTVGFIAEIPDGQFARPFYVKMHSQPECNCYEVEQHGS